MELIDTIELMQSTDYKDRFRAEYYQLKIRHHKLHTFIVKFDAGTLEFEPTCNIGLLRQQERDMEEYMRTLEIRAEIEGIELN